MTLISGCGGKVATVSSGADALGSTQQPDSGSDVGPSAIDGSVGLTDAGLDSIGSETVVDSSTTTPSTATAYLIDPNHTGTQPHDALTLPLVQRWSVGFDGTPSYPLIVDGRVFVLVSNVVVGEPNAVFTVDVRALSIDDGSTLWGPTSIGGVNPLNGGIAYDHGRLFLKNQDGAVSALDPATGSQLWVTTIPGALGTCFSPPTASNGILVSACDDVVYAFDETTGAVLWHTMGDQGYSGPIVTDTSVFVTTRCMYIYDYAATTGAVLWHLDSDCSGFGVGALGDGGGWISSLIDGKVYTRDGSNPATIFDPATGASFGTYAAMFGVVGGGGTVYLVTNDLDGNSVVTARDSSTQTATWTYTDRLGNVGVPLVVGHDVVVGSTSGFVTVLSAIDGTTKSSIQTGQEIQQPSQQFEGLAVAMAEAEDRLLVPAGKYLLAY
ncbi:MAG: PQQ-binding-like beta-propeller repeat protein [Polyangiales bacterium]